MSTKHRIYLNYNGNVHDVLIDPSLGLEDALVAWDENWKTYPVPTPKAIARSLNQHFKNLNMDLSFDYLNQSTSTPWKGKSKKDFEIWDGTNIPANVPLALKVTLGSNEITINATNAKDLLTQLKNHATFTDDGLAVLSLNGVGYIFYIGYDVGEYGGILAEYIPSEMDDSVWTEDTRLDLTIRLDSLWEGTLPSNLRYVLPFESISITLNSPTPELYDTLVRASYRLFESGENSYSVEYVNGGFKCTTRPAYWRLSKEFPVADETYGMFTYFMSQLKVSGSQGILMVPRTVPLNQPYPDQPIARQIAGDTVYYINDMFTHSVSLDFESEKLTNLTTVQSIGG